MSQFRVVVNSAVGNVEEFDHDYQSDAQESFYNEQNDDNSSVELLFVSSSGSEELLEEWHNEE